MDENSDPLDEADIPIPFDDFLHIDPLHMAESMTGLSYKDDEDTQRLGMMFAMLHGQAKEEELGLRSDSYYNIALRDFISIVQDLGFTEVFTETFLPPSNRGYEEETVSETYKVFWREGLLLTCESYRGERLNSSTVYFNAEFPDSRSAWSVHGLSGHLHSKSYDEERYVWVGSFDGREGLRHTVAQMEGAGTILASWVETPHLFLTNYAETRAECDYDMVNSMKIADLPETVQAAMGIAR